MNDELEYLMALHALHMLELDEVREVESYLQTNLEAYARYVQHLENCAKLARSVVLGMPTDLMPGILEKIRGGEVQKRNSENFKVHLA